MFCLFVNSMLYFLMVEILRILASHPELDDNAAITLE